MLREEDEIKRLKALWEIEHKYPECEYICGVDEVGRGPFAGPVMAGAVILPKDLMILYLNDSKKLSPKKREIVYQEIKEKALSYGIGVVSPGRIDEINILQATFEAMKLAVEDLDMVPDLLLIDAITIPDLPIRQIGIVKGDTKSASIAAASILAKVTRDRMMDEYAELYPEYGFEQNKGYGTKKHREAIIKYGQCPIHRRTYIH
jgi:ribonuclease HII